MTPYHELDALRELYVEDSFVLDIVVRPATLTLRVDFVLCEGHPDYGPAKPGEFATFRRGVLTFRDVTYLEWKDAGAKPLTDPDGEIDYGNIDTFEFEGRLYELTGEFGTITVNAATPSVELDRSGAPGGGDQ